jgi:glycosyltransferase involved in cell wall biosynthesis
MKGRPVILWLCSWYPHPASPFHGDFIQRHAHAVSAYADIHVLHIPLTGPTTASTAYEQKTETGSLMEWIRQIDYRPGDFLPINKVVYNWRYQQAWRHLLEAYVRTYGAPSLVHVHVAMKAGIAAQTFCKALQIPYVVSEHASLYDESGMDHWETRSVYFKTQTRNIMRNAAAISNVSARLAVRMEKLFDVAPVQVIRNVVDTTLFYPGHKPTRFRFLHASALGEQKRPYDMLQALQAFALEEGMDWELVVCGPADAALKEWAEVCQIADRIQWRGMISYESVAAEMRAASALILFSHHENFPCVVIEALCCGLPVLASDVGGVAEAISVENGILVSAQAGIPELSKAISSLYHRANFFDRDQIAQAARARYCYQTIGKEFYDWYQRVLMRQA